MQLLGKPMSATEVDWTAQQEAARQRSKAGGGTPGVATVEQVAGKSGPELLEAMMSGELPHPLMNETMNMTLLEVDDGRAVFQGTPLAQHSTLPEAPSSRSAWRTSSRRRPTPATTAASDESECPRRNSSTVPCRSAARFSDTRSYLRPTRRTVNFPTP